MPSFRFKGKNNFEVTMSSGKKMYFSVKANVADYGTPENTFRFCFTSKEDFLVFIENNINLYNQFLLADKNGFLDEPCDCPESMRVKEEKIATNGVKMIHIRCGICGHFKGYERQWTEESLDPADVFVFFGKYKGKNCSEIYSIDPGYAVWAIKNLDDEKIKTAFGKCLK